MNGQQESDKQMIKVCCISDTHNETDSFDLGEGDLLIHAGDFTLSGKYDEMEKFAKWFASQKYKHKIIIAGNHELTFDDDIFEEKKQKLMKE